MTPASDSQGAQTHWRTSSRQDLLAVEYGDPETIAMLTAVSLSDDPTNDPELAKQILDKVPLDAKIVASQQMQAWLDAEKENDNGNT